MLYRLKFSFKRTEVILPSNHFTMAELAHIAVIHIDAIVPLMFFLFFIALIHFIIFVHHIFIIAAFTLSKLEENFSLPLFYFLILGTSELRRELQHIL